MSRVCIVLLFTLLPTNEALNLQPAFLQIHKESYEGEAPIPDPTCKKGVMSPDMKVCCTDECGLCGNHKLCNDVGKYNEATGKLADNCCKDRIEEKAVSCEVNHPPCILSASYKESIDNYVIESPKRSAMEDCNKAVTIARASHAKGIQHGEWAAQLHVAVKEEFNDAKAIVDKVVGLCEKKASEAKSLQEEYAGKIAKATADDKILDPTSGKSNIKRWTTESDNRKADVAFFDKIIDAAKKADGLADQGLVTTKELEAELENVKDVQKFGLMMTSLVDDAKKVSTDSESLWQQWLDHAKDALKAEEEAHELRTKEMRAAKERLEKAAEEAKAKQLAAEKKAKEIAAAKKKAAEEAARKHAEEVAAAKKAAEEAAAAHKAAEEALAKKKAEQAAAKKRKAAAAELKQHEEEVAAAEAAAKKKREEAAAKKKAHDEAVAKQKAAEEAAAKKAAEFAAAKKAADVPIGECTWTAVAGKKAGGTLVMPWHFKDRTASGLPQPMAPSSFPGEGVFEYATSMGCSAVSCNPDASYDNHAFGLPKRGVCEIHTCGGCTTKEWESLVDEYGSYCKIVGECKEGVPLHDEEGWTTHVPSDGCFPHASQFTRSSA